MPSPRVDLGIETASDAVSLALLDADGPVAEHRWAVQTTIAAETLEHLDAMFSDAGVRPDAVTSVAVDVGPGGYGGLRAGVAMAQGLALALGVPLAGVGRLEVDAWPHLSDAPPGTPVVAVHDAGRSGLAWAAFQVEAAGAAPRVVTAPRIDDAAGAVAAAPEGAWWCGEVTPELRAGLEQSGRAGRVVDGRGRSAADVVRIARLHGAYGEPEAVDVTYLRPPPITQPRQA